MSHEQQYLDMLKQIYETMNFVTENESDIRTNFPMLLEKLQESNEMRNKVFDIYSMAKKIKHW